MLGREVLESLKEQVDINEREKYLNKIEYDAQRSGESKYIYVAKNIYIKNWVKTKYEKKIKEIIESRIDSKVKVVFEIKGQQEIIRQKNTGTRYRLKDARPQTNTAQTFENFVVGDSNRFAFECAKKAVETRVNNPLLIYGNTGLGKTHLLNAITNAVFNKIPNAQIVFMNAETMLNEYVDKSKKNELPFFRDRFRKCDYLIIDDIQFIAGKEAMQGEFFNTFNDLNDNKSQIIMTCDKKPDKVDKLESRLQSRFIGGMLVKIESPELDTKIDIIKKLCLKNNISVSQDFINQIAINLQSNMREIEGVINQLTFFKSMMVNDEKELLEHLLKDSKEKREVDLEEIINTIAKEYNMKPSDIKEKARGKIANARKIIAYIASNEFSIRHIEIAKELRLKDQSAVSKQIKTMNDKINKDSKLKAEIQNIISKIRQKSKN